MKKSIFIFYLLLSFIIPTSAQTEIPTGISYDSIYVKEMYSPNNLFRFYYYKPVSYDSLSSPVLFAIHGLGGNGLSPINDLIDIAERRKALIIAPDLGTGGFRLQEPVYIFSDTSSYYSDTINMVYGICGGIGPASEVFKYVYRHILNRENRIDIPSYLIGFSAGGQFVSRYMLIRQAYPDSIPLQMAVSSSAYYYTFPTDNFNGVEMIYMCGLLFDSPYLYTGDSAYCHIMNKIYNFNCYEHIMQYYNENYGVLIGTADTQYLNDTVSPCSMEQGTNRYVRANNFYNFCDSNAVNIGTVLKWEYDSIIGVGHNQYAIYNTKRNITDSSTIAETLLFETPFHNVTQVAPLAGFYADNDTITLPNATVNFINTSINSTNYLWDFGDSTTSTLVNPSHTYSTIAIDPLHSSVIGFTVQLTASNDNSCDNWNVKRYYIVVLNPTNIGNIFYAKNINIFPNPSDNECNIQFQTNENDFSIQVLNYLGQSVNITQNTNVDANNNVTVKLNTQNLIAGMYFVKITGSKVVIISKLVVQH